MFRSLFRNLLIIINFVMLLSIYIDCEDIQKIDNIFM